MKDKFVYCVYDFDTLSILAIFDNENTAALVSKRINQPDLFVTKQKVFSSLDEYFVEK